MNEHELRAFGLKIRNKLNAGLVDMNADTAERLRDARNAALQRAHAVRAETKLVAAGHSVIAWGRDVRRPLAMAAVVVALVIGFDHWQMATRARELEEVDAALLSDDLPIDAYLDHGFYRWLQKFDES